MSLSFKNCSFQEDSIDLLCDFVCISKSLTHLSVAFTPDELTPVSGLFDAIAQSRVIHVELEQLALSRYCATKLVKCAEKTPFLYKMDMKSVRFQSKYVFQTVIDGFVNARALADFSLVESWTSTNQTVLPDAVVQLIRSQPRMKVFNIQLQSPVIQSATLDLSAELERNRTIINLPSFLQECFIDAHHVIELSDHQNLISLLRICRALASGLNSKMRLPIEILTSCLRELLEEKSFAESDVNLIIRSLLNRETVGRTRVCKSIHFDFSSLYHLCSIAML